MVRIAFSIYMDINKPLKSDALQYDILAFSLASGNGYILKDDEPNITRAPLFPLFLAAVYKIVDHRPEVARISVCFLGTLIVLIIYLIGKESFTKIHGIISAAVASIYPPLVYISYEVLSENLFTLLLLICIYLLILSYKKDNKYYLTLFSGLILGLSALTRPIAIIVPVFLFPWFLVAFKAQIRLKVLLIFLLTFLVVQVPWVVRNYLVFKTVIVGTAKGGVDLWWSNNPGVISNDESKGRQYRYFPFKDMGYSIIEKNKEAYKLAFSFFSENISKIPKLIYYKQKNFWNLMAGENIYYNLISLLSYGILLPFYVFTLFRISFKPDERIIYLLVTLFFIFVTSLYYGTVRFRLPLEPIILILGVDGFFYIKNRIITLRCYLCNHIR